MYRDFSKQVITKISAAAGAVIAAMAMTGCGTLSVSDGITDDGRVAGDVTFPPPSDAVGLVQSSTPSLDNLREVAPGMDKDKLYELLGSPHFREGIGRVREWDYVFNFPADDRAAAETCRYKVIFDRRSLASTFYWEPSRCSDRLMVASTEMKAEPVAAMVPVEAPKAAAPMALQPRRTELKGDVLFPFDRSAVKDIRHEGTQALDRYAAELKTLGPIDRIEIVGHADRLGSDPYNRRLSEARAQSIGTFLGMHGVPADRIKAWGIGSDSPVVECTETNPKLLIDCLAPNRHVEIMTWRARDNH